MSSGVIGTGRSQFEAVVAQELEGVIAKQLASRYQAGRRSTSWLEIQRTQHLRYAIAGLTRTGSGLSAAMRAKLATLLAARRRDSPWLDCEIDGLWVEPGLYCTVSYLEMTRVGHLRAPVFLDLIADE